MRLSLLLGTLIGCAARPGLPLESMAPVESARVVVIGDTGALGGRHLSLDGRAAMISAIQREKPDLVIATGDLVYPAMVRCGAGDLNETAKERLDERVGDYLGAIGVPVLLVLGNHDLAQRPRAPARARCYELYAAEHPNLIFPGLDYSVDLGVVRVGVVDTNALPDWDGSAAYTGRLAPLGSDAWVLMAGHHPVRAYGDKEAEARVAQWFKWLNREWQFQPDLYVNGHAHVLQFGVYEGIPALTSGSGSKLRSAPLCTDTDRQGCGPGERYGRSVMGYGVVDITADQLQLRLRDGAGVDLGFCWQRGRDDPEGGACGPS